MIAHTPGVCGGRACLADTRMPVWCVYGLTEAEALEAFPWMTAAQHRAAVNYAAMYPDEIARDEAENRKSDRVDV